MKAIDLDKQLAMEMSKIGGKRKMPEQVRQRLEETYTSIELGLPLMNTAADSKRRKKTVHPWRRLSVAAASVAVLSAGLLGTAFVSPAMAQSLKQVPGMGQVFNLIGDLGLQTADEKGILQASRAEASQDHLKLKISEIVFDGARLSMALEREGDAGASEPLSAQLAKTELFVDGKPLEAEPGSLGGPIGSANATVMNFTDMKDLPDQFELTVKLYLQGIEKPFQLVTPVVKTAVRNIVLKPEIQAENKILRFRVDQVEITPSTVAVETTYTQLVDKLPDKYVDPATSAQTFDYDVTDGQGHELEFISGKGETLEANQSKGLRTLFTPFEEVPDTIVIKPYVFQYSSDGGIQKEYLPELELSLPVDRK